MDQAASLAEMVLAVMPLSSVTVVGTVLTVQMNTTNIVKVGYHF